MDIIPVLSTVILISTLVTLVLAVGSYFAYKMRESRRPRAPAQVAKPAFFRKYQPKQHSRGSADS